jgi:plasmid stabilization system protein ParE
MKLVFQALAEKELKSAALFYRREAGSAISQAFLTEVERVSKLLIEFPEFGTPLDMPPASSSRRYPLKRFPYDLMYRVQGDTIRVLAVTHQHRKPGYWQDRQ